MLPVLAVVIGVVAFEAAAVLTSTTLCAKKSKHKKGKKYKAPGKAQVYPQKKGKERRHGADVDVGPAIDAAVQSSCWGCGDGGGGGGGDGGGGDGGGGDGGGGDGGGGGGGCGGGGGG